MQAQGIQRFRGAHRPGNGYAEGDVVAAGRWSYVCLQDHVAGERSMPGIGDDWANYWAQTAGVMLGGKSVSPGAPAASAAAAPQSHTTLELVTRTPRPAPVPRHARAAMPAALPADEPPAASQIMDDSDEALPNVAMSLDALRQAIRQSARQEWVESELGKLRDLLERTLARIGAGVGPALTDDPVQAEAWRRKGKLLGATCRAEAQAMETAALRQCVQLLRKRDRGGSFTAAEALRAAHLDSILSGLADIDAVAEDLRLRPPKDPADDLHWRRP